MSHEISQPTERELLDTLSAAPIGWITVNADLRVTWANDGADRLCGHATLVGMSATDLVHPDDLSMVADSVREFEDRSRSPVPTVFRIRTSLGRYVPIEMWVQHCGQRGDAAFWVLAIRDAVPSVRVHDYIVAILQGTDLHTSLGHLIKSLRSQVDGDVAFYWGWNGAEYKYAVGTAPEYEWVGHGATAFPWLHTEPDRSLVEVLDLDALPQCVRRAPTTTGARACHAQNVATPGGERGTLILWDRRTWAIGTGGLRLLERTADLAMLALDRYATDAAIRTQATTDPLTGLANRAAFLDGLAQTMGTPCSVVLADLDGFKDVNDHYGHPTGDQVLSLFADRLRAAVRSFDLVARFGGDEFGILLRNGPGPRVVADVARRILATCREPFQLEVATDRPAGRRSEESSDSVRVQIGLSIGVASTVTHPTSAAVIAAADRALYRAKAAGRNQIAYDMPGVGVHMSRRRGARSSGAVEPVGTWNLHPPRPALSPHQ